ncbi:hypothetical protein BOX15_Mlig027223g1, partial [Macrostomum lignano]
NAAMSFACSVKTATITRCLLLSSQRWLSVVNAGNQSAMKSLRPVFSMPATAGATGVTRCLHTQPFDQQRPLICYNCRKPGHLAKDCPSGVICHNCGQEGHLSRDCKSLPRCHNCGQEGHLAKNCPSPVKCRICGQEGHLAANCPG